MPITVSHALSATTPDDPAYEIRPSHWNSNHNATFSAVGSEISGAFSNAGNVTFGLETNGYITASANAAGAGDGFNRISAGTQLAGTNATIVFSNSNGISFGMSNSSVVTAAHNGITQQSTQPVAASAANGSFAFSTLSFSNVNGISFGTSAGSAITASHNAITTARASNDAIGLNTAQSNVTWTANSSGLSLDARGYAGTATAVTGAAALTVNSNGVSFNGSSLAGVGTTFNGANISGSMTVNTAGVNLSMSVAAPGGGANFSAGVSTGGNTAGDTGVTGTRVVFAGGNNITVSQGTDANGATITISGANAGGAQTGISGIVVSNTTYTSGTVSFSNANGISFGSSAGQAITASYTVPSTAGLISAIGVTGSNGNFTTTGLSFSNANGMSFGTSAGSAITASYTVPTVTNSAWTVSDNATSGTVARLAFTNLNGVTLSLSSGAGGSHTIVGSHNALTSQSNQAASGSNGSFTFQTLSFSNANGISFGTSAGPAITASYTVPTQSAQTLGLYASSQTTGQSSSSTVDARSFSIVGAGGISVGLSAGSFIVSQTGGGGVNPAASASNGSFNFTTLNFSNANNVTFGTSAGGIITASVAAPGAAAENNWVNLLGANTAGNTTASGSTIGYSGINLTLSGTNGSVVNISAPATSSLSATGMLSISTNGSTISMGVGRTISGLVLAPFGGLGGPVPFAQSSISLGQNSLYMYPVQIEDYLTCDHFRIPVMMTNSSSAAASVQKGLTYQVGVYTRHSTNSTLLSQHYSSSYTMAASHNSNASWMLSMITGIGNSTSYNTLTASSAGLNLSASLHGPRELIVPVSSLFTPGEYVMAMLVSSSSAGAGGAVLNNSNMAVAYQTFNRVGASTNATGTGFYKFMNMGTYSATTGALPASISATQINQLGTMPIMFAAMGTV